MAEEPAPGTSSSSGRKRKLKFSEQELEHLIEGVVANHDRLFGANSRRVPEQEKRRIWQGIASAVNSVGVADRSLEELKKRWYDLRGRAKEKVAARLGESSGTGGGGPTVPPNTPMEDQVEETLEKEACVGFTRLDSSRTTQDTQGGDTSDSDRLVIDDSVLEEPTHTQAPAPNAATVPPSTFTGSVPPATAAAPSSAAIAAPIVLPATAAPPRAKARSVTPVAPAATATATPAGTPPATSTPATPVASSPSAGTSTSGAAPLSSQPPASQSGQQGRRGRSRQRSAAATRRANGDGQARLSIERRMLHIHQRQARQQGAIHLQLCNIGRNVACVATQIEGMRADLAGVGDGMARIAAAVEANTRAMNRMYGGQRRHHRQLLTQLGTYSRASYVSANATSLLARRCLTQQHTVIQCSVDMSRVLETLTTAVVALHPPPIPSVVGGDDASEGASSLSSQSASQAPLPTRSTRTPPLPDAPEEEGPQRRCGGTRSRHT